MGNSYRRRETFWIGDEDVDGDPGQDTSSSRRLVIYEVAQMVGSAIEEKVYRLKDTERIFAVSTIYGCYST